MRVGNPVRSLIHHGRQACRPLTFAGMAGLLALILGLFPPVPPPGAWASRAFARQDTPFRALLPLVISQVPPPAIYDLFGVEQDWDWLVDHFGAVTLERGTGSASVRVLRAIEGPATLVARIEDIHGVPLEGVPVIFYWPGAPSLPSGQQACGLDRGTVVLTKDNGNAEFPMGLGSYYFPPDGGPHVVWVPTAGTDCLGGLGMLGGTNHTHLDSVWTMP